MFFSLGLLFNLAIKTEITLFVRHTVSFYFNPALFPQMILVEGVIALALPYDFRSVAFFYRKQEVVWIFREPGGVESVRMELHITLD